MSRSLKVLPQSIAREAIAVLDLIKDGADVTGSSDALFLRAFNDRHPGFIKITKPRTRAHFGVRCTPKGKRLIRQYLLGDNTPI